MNGWRRNRVAAVLAVMAAIISVNAAALLTAGRQDPSQGSERVYVASSEDVSPTPVNPDPAADANAPDPTYNPSPLEALCV